MTSISPLSLVTKITIKEGTREFIVRHAVNPNIKHGDITYPLYNTIFELTMPMRHPAYVYMSLLTDACGNALSQKDIPIIDMLAIRERGCKFTMAKNGRRLNMTV